MKIVIVLQRKTNTSLISNTVWTTFIVLLLTLDFTQLYILDSRTKGQVVKEVDPVEKEAESRKMKILGGVIGVLLFALIVVICVYLFLRLVYFKRRQQPDQQELTRTTSVQAIRVRTYYELKG